MGRLPFTNGSKELECERDGEEVYCKVQKGDKTGKVHMASGPSGPELVKISGNKELVKESKDELAELIQVKLGTDEGVKGEF